MDRHFVTLQKTLKADPALKNAKLVTVSFDPDDRHAGGPEESTRRASTADLARWTFLTWRIATMWISFRGAVRSIGVARASTTHGDITHNLRTAVIGADGKLVKVYNRQRLVSGPGGWPN